MGKSRLIYEFTHSHRVQDWLILEASSVSYGKATSYLPVIDLLKGYFKIGDRDDHREMRAKVLGRVLGLDRALEPLLPPLLALLDVPVEDAGLADPRPAAAPPAHARRGQAPAAAGEPGAAAARGLRGPALDRRRDPGPARQPGGEPGVRPPPAPGELPPRVRAPLGQQDGLLPAPARHACPPRARRSCWRRCSGRTPGWSPLTQMLVKRGNPFFLEETVRTLVETGALAGERGAYRLTRPVEALQVPATVQTILAARIDRLPAEEKQLLQAASVIGKDVPYALLAAIAEQPEEALRRGLAHLQEAEFLYETQLFPDLEYTFKHALTHEVAYAEPAAGAAARAARRGRRPPSSVCTPIASSSTWSGWRTTRGRARCGTRRCATCARPAPRSSCARPTARRPTCFEQALDALRRLPEHPDAIAESLDLRFDLRNALLPARRVGTDREPPRRGRGPRGGRRRPAPPRPRAELQGDPVRGMAGDLAAAHPGRTSRPGHRRVAGGRRASRLSPTAILAGRTWRGASAARPSGTARPRSR